MNGSHKTRGLRLDLNHGFLKNIRSCLRVRAAEEGLVVEDSASVPGDVSSETGSFYRQQQPLSTHSSPTVAHRKTSAHQHTRLDLPMATSSDTDCDSDVASLPSQLELTSTERSLLQQADLSRFTSTAQSYIRRAILKPRSLSEDPLSDVGRVLVERSCRDSNYYVSAATVIRHIYQMAGINNPLSESFLRSVTAECYSNLQSSEEQLSPVTREQRHNSVSLMCELHRLFRQSSLPTDLILPMLHTVVCEVATEPRCLHADEIRFLKSNVQQYGDDFLLSFSDGQLEALLDVVRTAFLTIHFVEDIDTEEKFRWSKDLLFIIELLVGQFALKMEAKKFYFDSVALPFQ